MQNSLTIGHSYKNGLALRWKNTPNGHIFVTGQSGAGKSYFLQNLILQILQQGKARCIVLDASHDLVGGLPTAHGVPLKNLPKVSVTDVKSDAFSLNPVRLSLLADGRTEDCHTAATRVVEILRIVFRLSAVQGIYLTGALREYLTKCNGAGSLPGFLAFARTSLRKEE